MAAYLFAHFKGKGWHRETCISPLTFDEDGFMVPVVIG